MTHTVRNGWILVALALVAGGCVSRGRVLDRSERFQVASSSRGFRVDYGAADEDLVPELRRAVKLASLRVGRWGGFVSAVTLRVYPDHGALERAVGRHGYPWLRAWAQYDVVHLQSPRTWGIPWRQQLTELLAHELTHVAMYQAVAGPDDWGSKRLPLWFREGMASVSADQGYRRGSEAQIADALRTEPHLDPLNPNAQLLRSRKDLVYNSGHWAFSRLLVMGPGGEQEGVARVRSLMARMRAGADFAQAFHDSWGMSEQEFIRFWYESIGLRPAVTRAPRPSTPLRWAAGSAF